jgi:hypothetical protein
MLSNSILSYIIQATGKRAHIETYKFYFSNLQKKPRAKMWVDSTDCPLEELSGLVA